MNAQSHKQSNYSQELNRTQLRALLSVFRKNEWRGGMNPLTQKRGGAFSGMLGVIALNLFLSLAIAAITVKAPSMQSGITIGGLFILVIVGFQVLIEYGKTIIAPEDYSVIAPLPVSSKTFYIAKQIYFLTHVSIITLTLSLAPIIAVIIFSKSVILGIEALLVFWFCGIFAGQLVSIVYTVLLNTKRPERIERILGYAQMILSMGFSMMYIWFSRMAPILKTLDVDKVPLLKIAPSYWFTAPFRMALEGWSIEFALFAALGVIVISALYLLVTKNLSLTYAESLLRTNLSSKPISRSNKFSFATRLLKRNLAPETRAVLTLMKAQFRGDSRFRMQAVVMIPMLLFFGLTSFFNDSGFSDPFVSQLSGAADSSGSNLPAIYLIVMVLPMSIAISVFHSSAFKSAWIFYTSPVSRKQILTGARTIAFVMLLAPIFLALTGIFTYFYHNIFHAMMHALFVTAIVRIPVTVSVFINPGIPFSLPMQGGANFSMRAILNMIMPIIGMIPLIIIESTGYGGYLNYFIIISITLAIGWALTKVTDPYLEHRFKTWEFLS